MKAFKIFSMFALSAMMAACTSDEIEQIQKSQNTDGIPFTATIRIDEGATTRALTDNGTQIDAAWAVGEKVALVHNGVNDEMEVESVSGGVATISGTITGNPTDGDAVTVIYPSSAADGTTGNVKDDVLIGQDGTLTGTGGTSISEKYDVRKSSGAQLEVVSGTASLKGNVSLTSQIAIWKLTLQCGGAALSAKSLSVKDASNNLLASATLASAGSVFYVAIPAMTSVKITAVSGAKTYAYSKASVSINTGKYYQSTVNLTQEEYTDLSAIESANTYLVTAAGNYKFNATVKGNGGLDPITGVTATPITGIAGVKVLWELGTEQGRAIKYEGSAYDISYDDGYVYFSTPETFTQGNCYVAIYNSSNEILWSWLIWAGAEPSEVTSGTDKFMDRNLGSIAVGNYSRGFLYQWGRKDPFPAADGNNYTPYSYVPARLTSHSIVEAPITVAYAIANPTHFTSHSAWMTTDDYRSNLWSDTEKTIYDPCPAGWRVPTRTQMNNFKTNVGLGTLPGTGFIGTCSAGGDFGYGNPGTGYYRSSTVINRDNSYSFCNDGRVDQSWPNYEGFAVRPVRDVPAATSKSVTSLTTNEIGWRLGSNGVAYSPTGALPAGVTAEAIIAHVGAVTNYCDKFIAIALDDIDTSFPYWSTALTKVNTYAGNHPITIGGTKYNTNTTGSTYYDQVTPGTSTSSATATSQQTGWRLPSVTDWRYIFQGLCSGPSATSPVGVADGGAYGTGSTLQSAINTACGNTAIGAFGYWSSSAHNSIDGYVWIYKFDEGKFVYGDGTGGSRVRAVFAY